MVLTHTPHKVQTQPNVAIPIDSGCSGDQPAAGVGSADQRRTPSSSEEKIRLAVQPPWALDFSPSAPCPGSQNSRLELVLSSMGTEFKTLLCGPLLHHRFNSLLGRG